MRAVGFLMMSHMISSADLAGEAALMESYGAEVVYVVDSAGALPPCHVAERVVALQGAVGRCRWLPRPQQSGLCDRQCSRGGRRGGNVARWLDMRARSVRRERSYRGDLAGVETNVNIFALMDVVEDISVELVPRLPVIDRSALVLGYAGVYSSFHLHAERGTEVSR
jgi:4-hydroxy 2-oxovalerate aldolase